MVMLSSPLYAGYVAHKEWGIDLTKAKHDALISLMSYQKIQERLAGNPIVAGRYKDNEDFPLRGFVVCDDCDRPMTASWSKGRSSRYPYYHCNTKNCKGKNVRRDVMEVGFRQLLKKAKPSPQIINLAKAMIGDIFKKRQQSHSKAKMAIKKEISDLEERRQSILNRILKTSSDSVSVMFEKEIEKVDIEVGVKREQLMLSPEIVIPLDELVGTALSFLEKPQEIWLNGEYEDKKTVLQLTFAGKLRYNKKTGYGTADYSLPYSILGSIDPKKGSVVPGAGIEPATQGFSIPCSTN